MTKVNVTGSILQTAKDYAGKIAIQEFTEQKGLTIHYDNLSNEINNRINHLKKFNLCEGSRIAIFAPNSVEWILTFLTLGYLNFTLLLLDPNEDFNIIIDIINSSDIQALITTSELYELNVTSFSNKHPILDIQNKYKLLNNNSQTDSNPQNIDKEALAIVYTSGTTGRNKGVILTHKNLMCAIKGFINREGLSESDNVVSWPPLTHVGGLVNIVLSCLLSGVTITQMGKFDPKLFFQLIKQTKSTKVYVVPRVLELIDAKFQSKIANMSFVKKIIIKTLILISATFHHAFKINIGKFLFRSVNPFGPKLHTVSAAGAILSRELQLRLSYFGFNILNYYGQTETCGVCCGPLNNKSIISSVGKPFQGVEYKIHNPNEQGIGEIYIRGDSVMKGYFNLPKETEQVFHNGWLRTNDSGRIDSKGNIFVYGRTDDIIIASNGENVIPEEIENIYSNIPKVEQLIVFGVPQTDSSSQTICAAIKMQEGSSEIDKSEVRKILDKKSTTIPVHKWIRKVIFVNTSFKTRLYKAKRKLLLKKYLEEFQYTETDKKDLGIADTKKTSKKKKMNC